MLTEIQISAVSGEVKIPGLGEIGLDVDKDGVKGSFSTVIGKISTTVKKDRDLQSRLRAYLEPKTDGILNILNEGLFVPTTKRLKELGKEGLVVIVDNLDRLLKIEKASGRFLSQYIFCDRGNNLTGLQCHLIYTMPLALRYSDDYGLIKERFKSLPSILPMVPVKLRDGKVHSEGMKLLRDMVMARVPQSEEKKEESEVIKQVFGSSETLDYLCSMSGGHVRNLLIILNSWIKKAKKIPLSRDKLEEVIVEQRTEMLGGITKDEWELIRRVQQEKQLAGEEDYDKLIHNRFVFEYRDKDGSWYDINPVLEQLLQ